MVLMEDEVERAALKAEVDTLQEKHALELEEVQEISTGFKNEVGNGRYKNVNLQLRRIRKVMIPALKLKTRMLQTLQHLLSSYLLLQLENRNHHQLLHLCPSPKRHLLR